jgi:hypothetical protein
MSVTGFSSYTQALENFLPPSGAYIQPCSNLGTNERDVCVLKRRFVADHGGNIFFYLPDQQRLYNHTNQKTPLLSSPSSKNKKHVLKASGLWMPRAEDHCSKRQSLLRML